VLVMLGAAARGNALGGLVVAVVPTLLLTAVARRVRRHGVISWRYGRSQSANLEAVRGNPTVWLVAHLDSKSQTIPMLVRIASTGALHLVSAITLVAVLASTAVFTARPGLWPTLGTLAAIAAIPAVICFVRNDSPGAVDNASGVVATILAALSGKVKDLGVVITSGEELGLAGARAWAASAKPCIRVVNCDTVDDAGSWRCMYTGTNPQSITSAANAVGAELAVPVRVGRLIPGILADSIAFADAGMEAVTLSRGTLSTLARIHTWRDNTTGLSGRGAADASVLLSALAKELS
jgi:hypothetical protein